MAEPQQIANDTIAVNSDQKTGVISRQHRSVTVAKPSLRERKRLRQLPRKTTHSLHITRSTKPNLNRRTAHPQMIAAAAVFGNCLSASATGHQRPLLSISGCTGLGTLAEGNCSSSQAQV